MLKKLTLLFYAVMLMIYMTACAAPKPKEETEEPEEESQESGDEVEEAGEEAQEAGDKAQEAAPAMPVPAEEKPAGQ